MKTIFASLLCLLSFCGFAQKNTPKLNYGHNIVSFMPLYVITNNNVGVGVSYERLLNDYVGLRVPVAVGINSQYFNIGLEAKLYPGRNTGPAKYAIAPMLMFGTGNEKTFTEVWNPNTNMYDRISSSIPRTHFGFLLNHSFNFTVMQNFFIGMDGGIGINYYDDAVLNANGSRLSFLAQFQVLLGYRF